MMRDRIETTDVSALHPEVVNDLASAYEACFARVKGNGHD